MIIVPEINPVIVSFGVFAISYYSLAYVIGILIGWYYILRLIKELHLPLSISKIDNLISYIIPGIIIGGRIGYMIFYDTQRLFSVETFKTWNGGMSFHGGFFGVLITSYIFCKINKIDIILLLDLICMAAPIGVFFGRIANFINAEVCGRESSASWAVLFPHAQHPVHPSQIYEAISEGMLLFLLMYYNKDMLKNRSVATLAFTVGYSVARFCCEFFRMPDEQLGFLALGMTMGQLLTVFMLVFSLLFLLVVCNSNK